MEEETKTVHEIAKTVRKGLDFTEKFGSFLTRIFGEGFIHLGDSFSDWTKYFRYNNLLKLQDKVLSLHKKRSIEGKTIPIPPRYALPLLELASLMSDN